MSNFVLRQDYFQWRWINILDGLFKITHGAFTDSSNILNAPSQ